MIKEILKLYNNYLARFQFFRNFISVLIELNSEMEDNKKHIIKLEERVDELTKLTDELKESVSSLSEKNSESDFNNGRTKTAHNLLDRFKEAVQSE